MSPTCTLVLTAEQYQQLHRHLFPGDQDEHGAIIAAGLATDRTGHTRLLGRDLFLAADGKDYLPGKYGYRMLSAEFIQPVIRHCKKERLAYIAIHNHGDSNQVGFSKDDLDSHDRSYPALLDIANGMPVGAAVFATRACAGDIWFPDGSRRRFREVKIIGSTIHRLSDHATRDIPSAPGRSFYDRQMIMFGQAGQAQLAQARIAIIGLGGVGSLVAEYMGRLGVGNITLVDPDRIALSNLSRVSGATAWDARWPFSAAHMPAVIRRLAERYSARKVDIAKRAIHHANPECRVTTLAANFAIEGIARQCTDIDYLFLAADSMQARLVANAICQQYFVPGVQIGSKIVPSVDGYHIEQAFSIVRPLTPGRGCLWCNGAIDRTKLANEAKTEREREDARYGTEEPNPSVITLNATGAAQAANDFLFCYLRLRADDTAHHNLRFKHQNRTIAAEEILRASDCPECGPGLGSRFARGDHVGLPTLSNL